MDAASAGFVDRIGYRASIVIAHAMAAVGIAMMAVQARTFVGTLVGVFGEDLRTAFICAIIFPILMVLALVLYKKSAVSK